MLFPCAIYQFFLGLIIEQGWVKSDPAKIQAVAEWPIPTTRKQFQHFLGFTNFYWRFIHKYSRVAAHVTRLTYTNIPFTWTSEVDKASLTLNRLFTSALVLAHPNPGLQLIVEVNASDTGVGTVLSQWSLVDHKIHSCAFVLRCLSPAEQNSDVVTRSCSLWFWP